MIFLQQHPIIRKKGGVRVGAGEGEGGEEVGMIEKGEEEGEGREEEQKGGGEESKLRYPG